MNKTNSNFNCKKFEINNDNFSEQDLLINQLENEIYLKQQKQKDFADIHEKYEQLQIDIPKLNEFKNNLEKELNSLVCERNSQIKEIQNKNEILIQELNKKNEENQKLYEGNNNIYIEIEEKENDNKELEKLINEQELILKSLGEEKNEILKRKRGLGQKNELILNDIKYLKNEVESLNKKNQDDCILLKEKNDKNINLINQLNEEESNNRQFILELKDKENLLKDFKNKLFDLNLVLTTLKNTNIKRNENYQNNQKEIISLNDELIKEASYNEKLIEKREKMNELINEVENKTNLLEEENKNLENEIKIIKNKIN